MKKSLLMMVLVLSGAVRLSAETESFASCPVVQSRPEYNLFTCPNRKFTYVKLGVTSISTGKSPGYGVGIGFGYRAFAGRMGGDISVSYSYGLTSHEKASGSLILPRIRYLYAFSPECSQGFYVGAGLGGGWTWTKTRSNMTRKFGGVTSEFVLGYDLIRSAGIRQFIELEVSQPTIRLNRIKSGQRQIYAPTISLGFGIGF